MTKPHAEPARSVFITGFPAYLAVNLAKDLLNQHDDNRVVMLTREKHLPQWEDFQRALPEEQAARVRCFSGDVVHMDLGLSGDEYQELVSETDHIYHLAGSYWMGTEAHAAYEVNVEGTAEMLRLARECARLQRFSYFSTAFVSGDRTGVVLEEELDRGQRFRNAFEETRFRSERLVRRAFDEIPISIFRPSVVVGHSETGEIDRLSGPYYLMKAIVTWPVDVPVPLPGRGDAPMNLVPVDFVVGAARIISQDARGVGRTFHLTDPNPLPARRVFQLVAEAAGRRTPRGQLPTRMARTILKLPGLARRSADSRHFLEYFDQPVIWRCVNTLELLRGTFLTCPPFESYVEALVDYIRVRTEQRADVHPIA